ncbi:PAS domain S-box-containing protein [Halogranum amylolyticum]|uniref:histidine kinase n=1 Tax=Halogranum amylolyticum TaxID=660520 RepID=A0A1H8SLF4_9EURY|nr:PAS domain S-box protein [Halogranum amylolyticum]SEO79356.1 PAS domain S-box-containing protein [Halogranum amylolyticum]
MVSDVLTDGLRDTLTVFEESADLGEPLTATEVAERLDVSQRRGAARLDELVDQGFLRTKTVGTEEQVWWRPPKRAAETERSFSTLVENVPGMIYRCRNETGWPMEFVSDGCRQLTGYDPEALETGRISFGDDIVHPDDVDHVWHTVQEDLAHDGQFTVQYRIRTADDETHWVWERGRAVGDGSEEPPILEGLITDITELKTQAQHLKHEIDDVFERVDDAFYALDTDFRFTYVNEQAEELLQHTEEELLGESVWEEFPSATETPAWESLHEALKTNEPTNYEIYFEPLAFWVEANVYPSETGLSVYFRDITERKERERELERYETLFEESTDVNAVLDPDGTIQYITPSVGYVLDYDPEELVGDNVFEYIHPEDRKTMRERVAETVDEGENRPIAEFRLRHADGSWRWLEARGRNLLDDPQIEGIVAYTHDVTERVERKRELKRQREQLAALNDFNKVVRKIADAVIEESTREEIEQAACQQLVASDSYKFAWIAAVDPTTEQVTPRVEAGVEGYLDDVELSSALHEPIGQAFRTGELQVSGDVFADPDFEPWRDAAETYGFRSFAAIPIVHKDTLYGVLGVYSERVGAFAEDERSIVGQLGEVVGHAINAYERRQALMSDEAVELEFLAHDVLDDFGVSAPEESRITFDQAVPLGDDEFLMYGTTTGDAFEALEALADQLPHFAELTVVTETSDEIRYKLRLVEPPVLSTVAAHGGRIQTATIEDGDFRLIVEVPLGMDVRQMTDIVRDTYLAPELLAQRQVPQRDQTTERIHQVFTDDLTDRQRTALEVAYYAGFFEWPRTSTGEEIAESMNIAPATFHQHLRAGENKLLSALVAEEPALR